MRQRSAHKTRQRATRGKRHNRRPRSRRYSGSGRSLRAPRKTRRPCSRQRRKLLRQMFFLQTGVCQQLRSRRRRMGYRLPHRRHAGRTRARAICRLRPHANSGRGLRRTGAFHGRHTLHRLLGGKNIGNRARRHSVDNRRRTHRAMHSSMRHAAQSRENHRVRNIRAATRIRCRTLSRGDSDHARLLPRHHNSHERPRRRRPSDRGRRKRHLLRAGMAMRTPQRSSP